MNLKEAFRYQNKLQSFMSEALNILRVDENCIKVEATYLYHKVMPEVQNETVTEIPDTEYYNQINGIIRFVIFLMREKEKLATAIRKAKREQDIDMDSEISLNTARQSIAEVFKRMCDLRGSEMLSLNGGTGLRFNADGEQVTYKCDVKRVTLINFDRNAVRKELKKFNAESDAISTKIDYCMITSSVDYAPPFNVNESFDSAFEIYLNGTGE